MPLLLFEILARCEKDCGIVYIILIQQLFPEVCSLRKVHGLHAPKP